MRNPLLQSVDQILREGEVDVWREYDLIQALVRRGVLHKGYSADSLALYQAHFLTMNALYQLQIKFSGEGRYLNVDPLNITLTELQVPGAFPDSGAVITDNSNAVLAEYYLNEDNFRQASLGSVEDLLEEFWSRYFTHDDVGWALSVLELDAGADFQGIKRKYRELMMQYHPDRGGCAERVTDINRAMDILKQHHR